MAYRVFLVEDEIVTREGIRDNVNWEASGFEFCGEAPDGEMALPLIEDKKPDVLITDIKMPFMDGLQLSKIVREHMPWIKILILSGHNEFEYAQTAVKLGVTDYLLKPVSSQDLNKVLVNLAETLDQEKQNREKLMMLQTKIEDNLALSRERFLLKLVMGGISSAEALDQSQQFGIDIVARYYLIVLINIELCENSPPVDYDEYERVEQIISDIVGNYPGVYLTKKDFEEIILLVKGESIDQLVQDGKFLAGLIKNEVESQTTCSTVIEMGSCQNRLSRIHHSFAEALVRSRHANSSPFVTQSETIPVELINIDHIAIERFMKSGIMDEFDDFFTKTMRPIAEIAQKSYLIKHYVFVDISLSAAKFISDLGGEVEELLTNIHEIENLLKDVKSIDQIQSEMRRIFNIVLSYRNNQISIERNQALEKAKAYLDMNFSDPELKLHRVAQTVNISPNHFSTIFHQEFGITFRDYLSNLRINHAKELLRSTNLRCSEIAYQSGYNDSHYFSFVFKKKTGLTPRQFRAKSQDKNRAE